MSKFTPKEKVFKKIIPVYSNIELRELEKELEKYRIHKTLSTGEEITYCDTTKYLIKEGAMINENMIRDRIKYEELREKLDQLNNLQRKTDYAKRMKVEQLAENMEIRE